MGHGVHVICLAHTIAGWRFGICGSEYAVEGVIGRTGNELIAALMVKKVDEIIP